MSSIIAPRAWRSPPWFLSHLSPTAQQSLVAAEPPLLLLCPHSTWQFIKGNTSPPHHLISTATEAVAADKRVPESQRKPASVFPASFSPPVTRDEEGVGGGGGGGQTAAFMYLYIDAPHKKGEGLSRARRGRQSSLAARRGAQYWQSEAVPSQMGLFCPAGTLRRLNINANPGESSVLLPSLLTR